MMERYYRFAGLEIRVLMPEDMMYEREHRLEPFGVQTVQDPYSFQFARQQCLTEPEGECIVVQPGLRIYGDENKTVRYIGPVQQDWRNAYIRVERRGKENRVQLRAGDYVGRVGTNAVLDAVGAEHLIARNGGFLFHCAYIDVNGQAILFTAPSETGKSTQADLWHQLRGAEIVNGDRAAVRLVNGRLMAEGIPFSGSSRYCRNRSLPIKAIVYLGQAPQTTIRRLRGYEAFARIWEGVSVNTWDKKDVELVSQLVQRTAQQIPIFHMPCTPDESAVIALEDALRKQGD